MTDGSHTCGEHSIMNRAAKSLCCVLETKTNVISYVNHIQIMKKRKKREEEEGKD